MARKTDKERAAKLRGYEIVELGEASYYVFRNKRNQVGPFPTLEEAEAAMARAKLRRVKYMREVSRAS